mmetsp:Transcript_1909/g.5574  ORF Transcript_1909/g.5574 Transcript_1909/m.5574 type:complete len:143 (+) Transcript_1909:641-1069(+)
MAAKWPGWDVLVVIPSRLEAGASCFDHFLNRTTRTGEPLGYQGHTLKAARQLWSLLGAAGVLEPGWRQHAELSKSEIEEQAKGGGPGDLFPDIAVVGFSKVGNGALGNSVSSCTPCMPTSLHRCHIALLALASYRLDLPNLS